VTGLARSAEPTSQSLVQRHFLIQEERPAGVREVEIASLDPFLRGLLFTDGTVTRALGVQTLAPVSVERLDQVEVPAPGDVAEPLEVEVGETLVRRRVRIGLSAPPPILWAESFLIPDRLPPGFMGLLDGAPDGIGQSLQRFALESSRELLWFGLDAPPRWAATSGGAGGSTIRRLYRVLSGHQASILISESFAVEERAGVLHLVGLGRSDPSGRSPEAGR
jgi:chorismate--pyruvate lyase